VDALPQDPAARQEALERWAKQELQSKGSGRLRTKVAHRAARIARRVDRFAGLVLDRGLDTSGDAYLPVHKTEGRVLYVPSAWHVLPRALRYIGVSEHDTFVDFGCGKGRVLHQAARWPFNRVIGVEVSPELAKVARAALAARSHRHRCRSVEVVVSDVRQFQVPDDLTIAYFFRPFGDETLEAVLGAIVESIDRKPRRVRLIYLTPMTSRSTILATGRFRLVKQQSSALRRHADLVGIFESC
jgi:SAM-dependent methyltransferase